MKVARSLVAGSRTPVTITLLVKKPNPSSNKATIHYCDIGDYLSRREKLDKVVENKSVLSKTMKPQWLTLSPNQHGDWINQRREYPDSYLPITDTPDAILPGLTLGVVSARDAWVHNFSTTKLTSNVKGTIEFYNQELDRYQQLGKRLDRKGLASFTDNDLGRISWSRGLLQNLYSSKRHTWNPDAIVTSTYRPFNKQKLYFDSSLIELPRQFNKMLPFGEANIFILFTGLGTKTNFCALMVNQIANMDILGKSRCIPLYTYHEVKSGGLLEGAQNRREKQVNVSSKVWQQAQAKYGVNINKEDLFYYVYGFLHSKDYRVVFKDNLAKEIPRILLVSSHKDFVSFTNAGRRLADLHINYEQIALYPSCDLRGLDSKDFTVSEMKFADKTTKDSLIFNPNITISNIPPKAYQYVLNGKSPLEWVIGRYQVKQDKKSQLINDPNDWAKETNQPRYILDLVLKVINLSVKTVDIVEKLPKLRF